MTARFLDNEELGGAIAQVVAGQNVRCAVAFWGTGAVRHLFGSSLPGDARIICDLSIGSTNPAELRAMDAPGNKGLKHVERLHAKLYMSDLGAIVCSANASNNGIGFIDLAGLVEAGLFIGPETPAYAEAGAWFEKLWKRAEPVNQAALDEATKAWNSRPRAGRHQLRSITAGVPSLFATVAADPARYRRIGFVFTSGRATEAQRKTAARTLIGKDDERPAKLLSRNERQALKKWNVGDLFTGWSEQDLDVWPRRFVCIHRPRKRATYWFYHRAHDVLVGDDEATVFAERPAGLRAELGFAHGCDAMLANDVGLIDRLFDHCEKQGHWLCEGGDRLLELIAQVEGG